MHGPTFSLSEQSVVLYSYYYLPIINFFPLIQMPKIKKRKQKLTITISNTALVPQRQYSEEEGKHKDTHCFSSSFQCLQGFLN
ncbi:hypothetical protein VNO80_07894 [Phaseolus coccineus]|uniref:Uncharacterized protein n=1 Tax=Phaseolus coccineus TaxID=3886 RepID=A0AAN9RK09_PHACN